MQLEFKIKPFNELSPDELYAILQLRSEVFVVEQNCPYQDIDGKDDKATHLLGYYKGELTAYARVFNSKDYFDHASIGRVVVKAGYRDKKWGHDLMKTAIKAVQDCFNTTTITISAQLYLQKFYESHGFVTTSEVYLEDGIPHISMQRS